MRVDETRDDRNAVFYDASGKRRVRFRIVAVAVTLALLSGVAVFLVSLSADPQFPALLLSQSDRSPYPEAKPPALEGIALPRVRPGTAPLMFGFYVNWDPASLTSLKTNIGHLTHLVPEWLYLQNDAGAITDETDENVARLAKEAHLPILVMVSNYHDGWQPRVLHGVLSRPPSRRLLESNIRDRVVAHGFAGVNIDFEQVQDADRNLLTTFVRELGHLLGAQGLLLTEDLPTDSDTKAYDLKRLAQLNNYVVSILYDQHFESGPPGPIAAQDWFTRQLAGVRENLPPAKTVIAIGNYGYDWIVGSPDEGVEVASGDVPSAVTGGAIQWDPVAHNPVLRYEKSGLRHEVWYLDAVTALNELQAISKEGARGAALWRIGSEDPDLWSVLAQGAWPSNGYRTQRLSKLDAQESVTQYGEGEIIRLTETPRVGHRNVWRDKGEYAEQFEEYPSGYKIDSYGHASDKRVALTFDDGPDAIYTPKILDTLKAKSVPATFFVVGSRVEGSMDLLRRMYAEGHTIGNHTYSHPDMASTFDARTRLELSVTQRLIECSLGRSTTLFRPPYQADSEPRTPAELTPLERAQTLGYTMVGEKIDPRDWETRSSNQIVQAVLRDKDLGNVILLHDGGGDRSATVAALPRIIDTLRDKGYRFVSVGELLSKTRDDLMPVPPSSEMRWATIEGNLLTTKSTLCSLIGILFIFAICLTATRTIVYGVLSVVQKRKSARRRFDPEFAPPVSVVIAAYNEETVIVETVRSILDNGYDARFEVIVVDDGSQDATLQLLNDVFADERRLRILTQPNCGKAAALNRAIANAAYGVLVTLDADTIFAPGTISKLVRHLADNKVAAVSGNAKVGNGGKWLTRFQSLEYIYGFNLDRRALDLLNAVTVVPGAVSAWRKSVVLECGGFSHDTVAEDTDLTLAVRRRGLILRYDEEAIAYTEAPETIRDLVRQRLRWAFGTLQAAWKHRDTMFDPKYGTMAFITLPSIFIYQVILTTVSPTAELAISLAILQGNGKTVLVYYLALLLMDLATGMLAYSLEKENPANLGLLPFQRLFYPNLMLYVVGKAILSATTGRLLGWSRASRRVTVRRAQESDVADAVAS